MMKAAVVLSLALIAGSAFARNPPPQQPRFDTTTRQVQVPVAGGYVGTRDGAYHVPVGGGTVNTRTGQFTPD